MAVPMKSIPATENQAFERVRVRQMLAKIDQGNASPAGWMYHRQVLPGWPLLLVVLSAILTGRQWRCATVPLNGIRLAMLILIPQPLSRLPQLVWWHVMRRVIIAMGGAKLWAIGSRRT